MFKRQIYLVLLIAVFVPVLALHAQGAPDQINPALEDLSQRVGRSVGLGDLQRWFWEQETYPDTSLGCPQEGQSYAQVLTVGYKFTLTYLDVVYDYRVSADNTIAFLCSSSAQEAVTETPTAPTVEEGGYVPPCPAPEADRTYLRARLALGNQARVVPGLPNNLRSEATTSSALLGEIPGGGIFTVIGGPQCAEGLLWWQVNYDGQVGWTVEGRDASYWIEPLPPQPLPTSRTQITPENVAVLSEIARLQGNLRPVFAFSDQTGQLGVLGSRGSEGVWLYSLDALDAPPRILEDNDLLLSITFSPTRPQALTGGSNGRATLWDLRPDAPVTVTLSLQTHGSELGALAFHPSGEVFASAGRNALTNADVDRENAILVWDIESVTQQTVLPGHTAPVNALAYSPDGSTLASASDDGTVRLWDAATATTTAIIETENAAAVTSLAYSPNGQFIAYGLVDGSVVLADATTGSSLATLLGHTDAVNSMAFNPDSTLIASAGADGLVLVWNTQSDEALATLETGTEPVDSVAFTPDGTLLATAGRDRTVRFWGVENAVG